MKRSVAFLLVTVTAAVWSQTKVDLGRQTRNVDFSTAGSTKPAKTGATLPATCALGEIFFLTAISAGENLYGCTAANVWSALGHSGWSAGPGVVFTGSELSLDGSVVPTFLAGTGTPPSSCQVGQIYINTAVPAVHHCVANGVWSEGARASHVHSGGDVTTGTLPDARISANVVRSDRPQTYDAGQKQTFTAGPGSVGLNVGASSSEPPAGDGGDLYYNTTSGKFRCREAGQWKDCVVSTTYQSGLAHNAGVVSWNPGDASVVAVREEFLNNLTTSSLIGAHGWTVVASGGAASTLAAPVAGAANHPGLIALQTGTADGGQQGISLGADFAAPIFPRLDDSAGWEAIWVVQFPSTAAMKTECGLWGSPSGNNNGLLIRFSTADGDSQFRFAAVQAGAYAYSAQDSQIAPAANTWYTFRIRSTTPGTVLFSIAPEGGAYSPEQPISSGLPAGGLQPYCYLRTLEAAPKTANLDFFGFQWKGLPR